MPKELKLYRVLRKYGKNVILDICWAKDIEDVYTVMLWEKKDKPPLEISELPLGTESRCILSRHVADGRPWVVE